MKRTRTGSRERAEKEALVEAGRLWERIEDTSVWIEEFRVTALEAGAREWEVNNLERSIKDVKQAYGFVYARIQSEMAKQIKSESEVE